MLFQLLVTVCFGGALFLTWKRVRQSVLRPFEGLLWSLLWTGGTVLVWRPEATNLVAQAFGIGRGADFVLYVAVISLFFCFFLLALAVDRLGRQITKLVQHQALDDFRRRHPR